MIVLIATTLGGGDGDSGSGSRSTQAGKAERGHGKAHVPKYYVVQNGDTLTSIAQKTGIKVAEIQALNPEVDPQTLIAGEVLKLQK